MEIKEIIVYVLISVIIWGLIVIVVRVRTRKEICPDCDGHGAIKEVFTGSYLRPCYTCGGKGHI